MYRGLRTQGSQVRVLSGVPPPRRGHLRGKCSDQGLAVAPWRSGPPRLPSAEPQCPTEDSEVLHEGGGGLAPLTRTGRSRRPRVGPTSGQARPGEARQDHRSPKVAEVQHTQQSLVQSGLGWAEMQNGSASSGAFPFRRAISAGWSALKPPVRSGRRHRPLQPYRRPHWEVGNPPRGSVGGCCSPRRRASHNYWSHGQAISVIWRGPTSSCSECRLLPSTRKRARGASRSPRHRARRDAPS